MKSAFPGQISAINCCGGIDNCMAGKKGWERKKRTMPGPSGSGKNFRCCQKNKKIPVGNNIKITKTLPEII